MASHKILFTNLVKQLLPPHRRQKTRLSLLTSFVAPLQKLFTEFDTWRGHTRMIVNVTSQVAALEGYLKSKYNEPITIKIVTYDDGALELCTFAEGDTLSVDIGCETELDSPPMPLHKEGETRIEFGDANFLVYLPLSVDKVALTADIERFKQALLKYKLIQN